jgi:hypothetical protein
LERAVLCWVAPNFSGPCCRSIDQRGAGDRGGSTGLPLQRRAVCGARPGVSLGSKRVREAFRGLEEKECVGGAWNGSVGARRPDWCGGGGCDCARPFRGPRLRLACST